MQVAQVVPFGRNEITHSSCTVEPGSQVPRIPRTAKAFEQSMRRKGDAHRHAIVIAGSEALGNALSQTANAHNQFNLICAGFCELGNEKRFTVFQQRGVGM